MSYPHGSIIEQIFAVRDIDKAIEAWSNVLGAGPFFLGESYIPAERSSRRGVPGPLSMKVAYGVSAGILIELVQPLPDDRSIYSEALAAAGDAPHGQALAFLVNLDWEEGCALMSSRYEEAMHVVTNVGGLRCTFFDARKDVGAYIEIGETAPQFLPAMIAAMKSCAADWDGQKVYNLQDVLKQTTTA